MFGVAWSVDDEVWLACFSPCEDVRNDEKLTILLVKLILLY
jgi:hypothetical protein